MDGSAHKEGHQQAEHDLQPHGASEVAKELDGDEQEHDRHEPEAEAEQPLFQGGQAVDEDGLGVEVAQGGEDGQEQADDRSHFSVDGWFFGWFGLSFGGGLAAALRGGFSLGTGGFRLSSASLLLCCRHKTPLF